MTIVDPVQTFLAAMVAIIDSDSALQALFGRTSGLCVPFDTLVTAPTPPIIVFQSVDGSTAASGFPYIDVQFSAFAVDAAVANQAIARLAPSDTVPLANRLLTWTAFNGRGVDACPNPERVSLRQWPGTQAEPNDPAPVRADCTLSFLIPG